jgi:hypothetical protein
MAQYCIKGKRIRNVCIPKEYDIDKIRIGIPVMDDEAERVGLTKVGDTVLPSGTFGAQSRKMRMDMFMQINLSLKSVDMYQQTGFTLLGTQMLLR